MPRPSINVSINGSCFESHIPSSYTNVTNTPAMAASESVSGPAKRRKPAGWIPPTNYSILAWNRRWSQGVYVEQTFPMANPKNLTTSKWEGNIGNVPANFGNQCGAMQDFYGPKGTSLAQRDRALTKARVKMKRAEVNLGVAFAERNRTAQLVGDTAMQLVKSVRALRKGDFRGAGRALGLTSNKKPRGSSVTSRWLELQYGWKPLLSDVYGSVDALARRHKFDWIVTSKAADMNKADLSGYIRQGVRGHGLCYVKAMNGYFVRIDAIPENDLLLSLTSLGLTNPGLIAWELVPFSFVADWFLPIGQFLDQVDALLGYGPTWSSVSSFEKIEWRHQLLSYHFGGTPTKTGIKLDPRCSDGYQRYVNLGRQGGAGVPMPSFPRIRDPRSLDHMANGLSLLSQAFGSRR